MCTVGFLVALALQALRAHKIMKGMNKNTGRVIRNEAWVLQMLQTFFQTPAGTRIFRRGYGLINVIDHPNNNATRAQLQAQVLEALHQYEPNLNVVSFNLTPLDRSININRNSAMNVNMTVRVLPGQNILNVQGVISSGQTS